ncbi:hypothetical protein SRRS_07770 [Sporomusa rhizae]
MPVGRGLAGQTSDFLELNNKGGSLYGRNKTCGDYSGSDLRLGD